jgi:hypothetical protein
MTCFRVSKAYLKRLLSSLCLRIPIENSIVLREGFLGLNRFIYLS